MMPVDPNLVDFKDTLYPEREPLARPTAEQLAMLPKGVDPLDYLVAVLGAVVHLLSSSEHEPARAVDVALWFVLAWRKLFPRVPPPAVVIGNVSMEWRNGEVITEPDRLLKLAPLIVQHEELQGKYQEALDLLAVERQKHSDAQREIAELNEDLRIFQERAKNAEADHAALVLELSRQPDTVQDLREQLDAAKARNLDELRAALANMHDKHRELLEGASVVNVRELSEKLATAQQEAEMWRKNAENIGRVSFEEGQSQGRRENAAIRRRLRSQLHHAEQSALILRTAVRGLTACAELVPQLYEAANEGKNEEANRLRVKLADVRAQLQAERERAEGEKP